MGLLTKKKKDSNKKEQPKAEGQYVDALAKENTDVEQVSNNDSELKDVSQTNDNTNSKKGRKKKKVKAKKQKKSKKEQDYPTNREPEIRERMDREVAAENPDLKKSSREYKKKRKAKVKQKLELHQTALDQIKPVGNIKVSSNYLEMGGKFARILSFIVTPGAFNNLRPMWGIDTIPKIVSDTRLRDMDADAKVIHSFNIRSNKWVQSKIPEAMDVSKTGFNETANSSQAMDADKYKDRYSDTRVIANEVRNGSTYLDLSIRVIVTAPSEDDLNAAIRILEREYRSTFQQTISLVPYVSQQQDEYAGMLNPAESQLGDNYQLTSRELAGSYPFITSGINDDTGTYVGALAYEVNSNPVLLDMLDFNELAIVCAKGEAEDLRSRSNRNIRYNFKATTGWSVQIAQTALMQNQRAVHLVLNGEDPRKVGVDLQNETAYIDLSHESAGVNMMESFSIGMDEIAAMSVLQDKIATMVSQFSNQTNDLDDSKLKSRDLTNLKSLLRAFYIHEGMWQPNAKSNREQLRLLGIPHKEVPQLGDFMLYLNNRLQDARKKASQQEGSAEDLDSFEKLYMTIKNMSDNYSDLFDRKTTIFRSMIERSAQSIFDFGTLYKRSNEALMAHFVNVFSYSEQELHENDVLIIHGADFMTRSVADFLNKRIYQMFDRGVKVILLYERDDVLFSKKKEHEQHRKWFENAEYRLTNPLSTTAIHQYSEILNVNLPTTVQQAMQGAERHIYLMNRRTKRHNDRIIFNWHMYL